MKSTGRRTRDHAITYSLRHSNIIHVPFYLAFTVRSSSNFPLHIPAKCSDTQILCFNFF